MSAQADNDLALKRTAGFRAAKAGCIHVRCPECGMKRSNVPRQSYDPARAALIETLCEKCCNRLSALDPPCDYFDATGTAINDKEVRRAYEAA